MSDLERYTDWLQWHNSIERFDYDTVVDWAIAKIQSGVESENVLILASFSKPVDRVEMLPYLSGALRELNLEEKYEDYSLTANAHFHTSQILMGHEVRKNLADLSVLCLSSFYDEGLMPFYLLSPAWDQLEEIGANHYVEGVDLANIEDKVKEAAQLWIDVNIHGKVIEPEVVTVPEKQSLWRSIWSCLRGNK